MNAGVLAAFSAAMLYNLAIVVQKTQAEKTTASGVQILGALSKRPLWLLGSPSRSRDSCCTRSR